MDKSEELYALHGRRELQKGKAQKPERGVRLTMDSTGLLDVRMSRKISTVLKPLGWTKAVWGSQKERKMDHRG